MRVIVAGSGGFIGGHLVSALKNAGHDVATLVRRQPRQAGEYAWLPDRRILPADALAGADVVINLCGAGVGDRRWTKRRQQLLRSSRLEPTTLLARACARQEVPVLINASAVGYYGDRGESILTETASPGDGFLARLCVDWEAAAHQATSAGVRVVTLRTGLVLGPDGGLLPRLAALTNAYLGGRLGSGGQYWPWISITDHVNAILFACRTPVSGPINLCAPEPATNRQFTAALGAAMNRPVPWVVPATALRGVLGGFAREVLASQRAIPAALGEAGFRFLQPSLTTTLASWAA